MAFTFFHKKTRLETLEEEFTEVVEKQEKLTEDTLNMNKRISELSRDGGFNNPTKKHVASEYLKEIDDNENEILHLAKRARKLNAQLKKLKG